MINEMLLEHEAPFLDNGEESLFERPGINVEPDINHFGTLNEKKNINIYMDTNTDHFTPARAVHAG